MTAAPGRLAGGLTAAALRRIDPAVAIAFRTRAEREAADEAQLELHDADPVHSPALLSVRPAPGSPVPSRLDRDVDLVSAALEAGRVAMHAVLDGLPARSQRS
jgi:hypothetical protein